MRKVLTLVAWSLLAACGDKAPESKTAKEVGNLPRQTMDRASTGVEAAIQQGTERMKDEDKK